MFDLDQRVQALHADDQQHEEDATADPGLRARSPA